MKTAFRGNPAIFNATFIDGAVPLAPLNSNYPKYAVVDPNGVTVQAGAAASLGSGVFRAEWTPLKNAQLSAEGSADWNIQWTLVDENRKQYTHTENFAVIDDVVLEEAGREQKFIALGGKQYLAKIVLPVNPDGLILEFIDKHTEERLVTAQKADLVQRGSGSFYSFEYMVPALASEKQYIALWTVMDAPSSAPRYVFQMVNSIGLRTMSLIPDVRMLVDKFQKVAGSVQAYEDSDILEYLQHGVAYVNATHPATNWNLQASSPMWAFSHFVVMAASWYGLTAQHLLEGDMSFSFTGLSTTMEMDRTSAIESAIGRMQAHMAEVLPKAKLKAFRRHSGMGTAGVRIFGRRNNFENMSYKIGSQSGAELMQFVQGLGIFTG